MVRCPSVVHCRPHFQTWISLKPVGQSDQILCVASLGWGKDCIRFWGRFDQNSDFHGNRNPPMTYNGENNVSTFSRSILIRSFLYLQVTRTCIKSQTGSNFRQIGPLNTELAALERLKNFPQTYNGKCCSHASLFIFDQIIIIVAGNQDRYKSSDEFDFGPDQTVQDVGSDCISSWSLLIILLYFSLWSYLPVNDKILHFWTWISLRPVGQSWSSLRPVGQSWSNFICSITGGGERLHNVLRQIGSKLWCPWQQKLSIDL